MGLGLSSGGANAWLNGFGPSPCARATIITSSASMPPPRCYAMSATLLTRERDWRPEGGETNPFLHLSMHLAIEEQLSIDQPPGIRAAVRGLAARRDSEHDARHDVMECLHETVQALDAGPVAAQRAFPIGSDDDADAVFARAAEVAAELLDDVLGGEPDVSTHPRSGPAASRTIFSTSSRPSSRPQVAVRRP